MLLVNKDTIKKIFLETLNVFNVDRLVRHALKLIQMIKQLTNAYLVIKHLL